MSCDTTVVMKVMEITGAPDKTNPYLAPLISSAVIILLFIIERVLSYQIRKREIRRSWFQKTIVEPNLETINNFFIACSEDLRTALGDLQQSTNLGHEAFLKLGAQKNQVFQNKKAKFEVEVIYLVAAYDTSVAAEITKLIGQLEDLISNANGANDPSAVNINEQEKSIHALKTKFYTILYEPIEPKAFWSKEAKPD